MAENHEEAYVCSLSPELIKQAQEELHENPESRSKDIQALREMVQKEKALRIRTDDAYLLRFLRAKKFDCERAFKLIMTHFKMRAENPDLFDGLCPSAVKHVLEAGITGVLPHRDKLGRRVIVFRPGKWNPSHFSLYDVFKANFITMCSLVEDEETQISGVIMLIDLQGFGMSQGKHVSPLNVKRLMSLLQDAFPARFKGIHYIHEPAVFTCICAIVKKLMKKKIASRLHFHGNKLKKLKAYIDEEYLPEDYGGKGPVYSNKEWMEQLLQLDVHFQQENEYGFFDRTLQKQAVGSK